MKKVSKLKILTVVLMGIMILCSAKMTFAAQSISTISTSSGNSSNNNISEIGNSSNNTNGTDNNLTNTNNVANNTLQPTNNNTVQNTTLPDTGAKSSVAIVFLIVLASISAIYTYKKVKEYNI